MFQSKNWSSKSLSVMLISLLLVSMFMSTTTIVKAQEPLFTLHAVLNSANPYWGYFGGYHDAMYLIKDELAKIGIDLQLHFYDFATIYSYVTDNWNVSGAPPGWDMTCGSWWVPVDSLMFFSSYVLNSTHPPYGTNYGPWLGEKKDKIFIEAEASIDPVKRGELMWKWQEIFMHDCPIINLFYGDSYWATARYFSGHDLAASFFDISHYWLNNSDPINERPGILTMAMNDNIYQFSQFFELTYTQSFLRDFTHDRLYKSTRVPWYPVQNATTQADVETYKPMTMPELAADHPAYLNGGTTAIVPVRTDVWWVWNNGTKYYQLDAYDVAWTFDVIMDPTSGHYGRASVTPYVKSVTALNSTHVQFDLHKPYADFEALLANAWACTLGPKKLLENVPRSDLATHQSNTDIFYMPCNGPFLVKEYVVDSYITVEANPYYYGNTTGTIDKVVFSIITDPGARILALQNLDCELSLGLTASVETFEDMKTWGTHTVYTYDNHYGNHIWLNLNNPILSNRYVRLAIAHAIPYPKIINEIIPGWGIQGEPGKTPIGRATSYKGVRLFNTELEPYEYNLTKAQQYLDMWKYSTDSNNWDKGPVGDTDASGFVNLDDWWVWKQNQGTGTWPVVEYAGQVIDPDFDNDNDVDNADLGYWFTYYGTAYPFGGAR